MFLFLKSSYRKFSPIAYRCTLIRTFEWFINFMHRSVSFLKQLMRLDGGSTRQQNSANKKNLKTIEFCLLKPFRTFFYCYLKCFLSILWNKLLSNFLLRRKVLNFASIRVSKYRTNAWSVLRTLLITCNIKNMGLRLSHIQHSCLKQW